MPTIHTQPSRRLAVRRRRRGGFTLVEMLVVIGIILVLMGILLPTIAKAYNNGVRKRMEGDLLSMVSALEAYKQDHGDIPRVAPAASTGPTVALFERGDSILCRALMAPQNLAADGNDGLGFRVRPAVGGVAQGKVYGPYLGPDKYKYDPTNLWILDKNGVRVLYTAANKGSNINAPSGYVASSANYYGSGARPAFNTLDNDMTLFDYGGTSLANGTARFQLLLGADPGTGMAVDPQYTGDFLLWSAGPDEKFGYADAPNLALSDKQRALSDDVSYPPR